MRKIMTSEEFVKKLVDVATNYKTLYVMGCFGSPLTESMKARMMAHNPYNAQPTRVKHINKADSKTFGFDCVNLIKGIAWGWDGSYNKIHGGARYNTNGVRDIDADMMFRLCEDGTTVFNKLYPGEALWSKRHIGIYIGNGLAVECTPAWKNCVQITAVKNLGSVNGYPGRTWTKHGHLPFIEYPEEPDDEIKIPAPRYHDTEYSGKHKVIAPVSVFLRYGPGKTYDIVKVLRRDDIVLCGGYSTCGSSKWSEILDPKTKKAIGYCSARYLRKI